VAAEHGDLWNIAGGDIADAAQRSALLDRYCTEIGRDPAAITRSIHLRVSYDHPDTTRDAISEALDAGFRHITLGLPAPWPAGVAGGSRMSSSPSRCSRPARRFMSEDRVFVLPGIPAGDTVEDPELGV
jgi:alkanesulfonate monooxygenase SsuD/methylene tetrahydromethanopterin reductase-like flavin-dependent oxidoreductase (luciferase family)